MPEIKYIVDLRDGSIVASWNTAANAAVINEWATYHGWTGGNYRTISEADLRSGRIPQHARYGETTFGA